MVKNYTRLIATLRGAWLAIMIGTLAIIASSTAMAKQESRTVTARVDYASGTSAGINAERVPGPFTIPEGCVATGFKYHFHDPAADYTSTRLGQANIYSITRGKWIEVAGGDPNSTLPPGKYKFVVGGHPGAYGSLSFKLVPTTDTKDTDDSCPNTDRLRNFDATFSPLDDIYLLESGSKKRLRDIEGIETMTYPATVIVSFREGKAHAQYTVTAKGDASRLTTEETIAGQLSHGRFSGIDTGDNHYDFDFEGRTIAYRMGIAWSLDGQIESGGLLILHGRWHHDFGETVHLEFNGQKELHAKNVPYSSPPSLKNLQLEIHLHLPAGQAQTSPTLPKDASSSTRPPAVGSQPRRAPNGRTDTGTSHANIWGDGNNRTTPIKPAKPAGDGVDWQKAANHGPK